MLCSSMVTGSLVIRFIQVAHICNLRSTTCVHVAQWLKHLTVSLVIKLKVHICNLCSTIGVHVAQWLEYLTVSLVIKLQVHICNLRSTI